MTPETMRSALLRQTPEQRKTMLFVLGYSPLVVENFTAGWGELTEDQANKVKAWLLGRYAMTAAGGWVLLPERDRSVRPVGCKIPPQMRGYVDQDFPVRKKAGPEQPTPTPPKPKPIPTGAKSLAAAFLGHGKG